jgi:hypothetical protein
LGLAAITFHQEWRWYTQDVGRSAAQLADSGYIVSGGFQVSTSVFGVVLARTDSLGDTTWVKNIRNLDADGGFSCRLTDGGYAVLAESGAKIRVLKYNPTGDSAWAYRSAWGGPISAFIPTFDGGCLVAGRIPDTAYDMGVVKLAADGHEEWARHYREPWMDNSWARGASQTRDSGYILCGDANNYVSTNMRLVRLAPSGDTVWTRLYHGPVGPELTDVREMSDSGFLAVGYEFDTLNLRDALYMMRTTSHGDTVWTRHLAPAGAASQAAAMCATSDGGFAIAGQIYWDDSARVWLVKLDADADTVWTSVLPGSGREQAADVQQTADGGYVIAGTSDSLGGSVLLVKTDSLGRLLTGLAEQGPAVRERIALSVAPNPASGVVRIKYSLPGKAGANLRLYDVAGKLVRTLTGAARCALPVTGLSKGVYLLKLDYAGRTATRKLVVE